MPHGIGEQALGQWADQ